MRSEIAKVYNKNVDFIKKHNEILSIAFKIPMIEKPWNKIPVKVVIEEGKKDGTFSRGSYTKEAYFSLFRTFKKQNL